jgi:hypothetical protein
MNSTIPVDLLELKTRIETWRTNRKYMREPIPDELWNSAAELSRRYPCASPKLDSPVFSTTSHLILPLTIFQIKIRT